MVDFRVGRGGVFEGESFYVGFDNTTLDQEIRNIKLGTDSKANNIFKKENEDFKRNSELQYKYFLLLARLGMGEMSWRQYCGPVLCRRMHGTRTA